ncbi:MAG TPA: Gfo/Idh/MocA family oxidoreductase [Bacteroidales bacterium]|nr:Gfo/Idh/MocA family oxidoreductase [Bacteroidales bacterium]HCI54321.1 gfo/Idh/MocA family oxidoreductase [Bacteroidales bacterium]HOU97111.1 Gfo/Idh/MocA family oxidoreductase [Bacteroidales bacterium]HQG36367.1 Gfo/Idh/MocA family oxidoreductase [Bacteroidales bacterium]HQG52449.1 Gfo/Idh/MocA family oxidoreductase [Bacteroidales bacterium]
MKKKNTEKKDLKSGRITRRTFLGTTAAAAAGFTIIPRHVLGGKGYTAPSDIVNVAGIGVGSQGGGDIQQLCTPDVPIVRPQRNSNGTPLTKEQIAAAEARRAEMMKKMKAEGGRPGGFDPNAPVQTGAAGSKVIKLANIYALCDVDSEYAGYIFKGYPKAKIYSDWREMLEKEKSIDAVLIGTPDHNHAPIAAAFMREKKHVYIEKPMAKTIFECRKLAELAKETGVVTQMGNQGHATEGTRRTVELIQSGVIGNVKEVWLSTNRPLGFWPQGDIQRPAGMTPPKNLNYDVWLGPAPYKPYHPDTLHFYWRGLWDYGTGAMGDMGAHIFDAPIWALNLGMPTKIQVQATSSPYNDEYLPLCELVTYEFPARGNMPPVKVYWCDGGLRPPRPKELEPGRPMRDATYYGEKGIITHGSHGAMPEFIPANPDFKGPDPWLPRTGNIFEDWIDAIKNGKKSCNDFSISAKVTELMLLTNIAVKHQRDNVILDYDAANMKITNLPAANNLFHYEYRSGWKL